MRSTLFTLVFVASSTLVACGGSTPPAEHAHHEHGGATASSAKVVPNGDAKVGDTTNCMVSGEEFVVTENSPKVEHDGKTYYLCCSGCAKKFQADPHKYIKNHGS